MNRGAWISIAFLCAWAGGNAEAATVRKVQFAGLDRLEIALDHAISPTQVHTEFLRDIIQVTLDGATVYPARIIPASQSERILKVFAYQYSPKQVRIRISTRGASATYRPAFSLQQHGRSLWASLRVAESPKPVVMDTVASSASRATASAQVSEPELLKKIENADKPAAGNNPEASRPKTTIAPSPLPSVGKVLFGLLIAIGGIVALLMGLKRLQRVAEKSQKKMQGFFAKMGLAKKTPMIEVVSTQVLGPKKSISVVRVQGRLLVLGIAQDSISLITDLGDNDGPAEAGTEFGAILSEKVVKEEKEDARTRIRARLQGLGPL